MGRRIATGHPDEVEDLANIGQELRTRRKAQGLGMEAVAKTAGISRVTLYRVEKGEASVTVGAVLRVARALGTSLIIGSPRTANLPTTLRLSEYPVLSRLAWQLQPDTELSPAEAWSLLSREWRHVGPDTLTKVDSVLIEQLEETFGTIDRVSPPPPSANRHHP